MIGRRRSRAATSAGELALSRAEPQPHAAASWLPTPVSLAVAGAILLGAVGVYLAARQTSLFAITRVEVTGADPEVTAKVKAALEPLTGTSLVTFGRGAADSRLTEVPEVAAARYDRDFPHTLRVAVDAEQPVAVIRRGRAGWIVSARGRVLRELSVGPYPELPRIWVQRDVEPSIGATVDGNAGTALTVVRALRRARFPLRVRSVRAGPGALTLALASGTEVLVGDASNLRLKLAVARRVLVLADGARYLDVSVPERVVTGGTEHQVESES